MSQKGNANSTVNIVSPELPAGVAWLVNCLIELGLPAWNPWDVMIPNEWLKISENTYRYNDPEHNWQQTLPALKHNKEYQFDPMRSIFVSHRWPLTLPDNCQQILFFRDPRDMLFSQWRRLKHNQQRFELSFHSFVDSQYHHYPLSYEEYMLLYMHLWMQVYDPSKHLFIKFESYRNDPINTLKTVLEYLSLNVGDKRIKQAVLNSDFTVCHQVEQQLAASGQLQNKYNYSATPFEYKLRTNKAGSMQLSPAFNRCCEWLGYEKSQLSFDENARPLKAAQIQQIIDAIYHEEKQPDEMHQMVGLFQSVNISHNWKYLS